jgi:hypothetical protein
MLADNFFPGIALHSLSAGIPGEYFALGVEHKNRVISYAFHEQTEKFGVPGEIANAGAVNRNRQSARSFYHVYSPKSE